MEGRRSIVSDTEMNLKRKKRVNKRFQRAILIWQRMRKRAEVTTDTEEELKADRLMDHGSDALLSSTTSAGFRQTNVRHYKSLFTATCSWV